MNPTATTGEMTKLAAARLRGSAARRARAALAWLDSHRRPAAAAVGALGLVLLALVWPKSAPGTAASADRITALVRARANDRLGAGAAAAVEHARAAQGVGEYGEMLEALETAVRADPSLAHAPELISLALQSFNAGRDSRSHALLQSSDRRVVEPLLQAATADYSYRVRHGAADALKRLGVPVADPVPMYLLDVWQHERCESRRTAAKALLAAAPGDARAVEGLEAAARRSGDEGCLAPMARVRR